MSILAVLFALAPFGFGVIRAVTTGHDFRMLAMAVAAFAGVLIITLIGQSRAGVAASSGAVFFVATVIAACVADLMGATAAAGIWPVAIVFGLCYAASDILRKRSRGAITSA
jgi:hypothetical protein